MRTATFITVATAALLAKAAPAPPTTTSPLNLLDDRQPYEECTTPGESFYICSNGYEGCFAQDPCSLTPITSTAIAPAEACTTGAVMEPIMYNLYPSEPDRSEASVSQLELRTQTGNETLEQVAVFSNIPPGATSCKLSWIQAAASERDFVVEGSGYTSVLHLPGFPGQGEPVSWNSVEPFAEASSSTAQHPDFTNWDKPDQGATEHLNGPVDCAASIYLKLAIDTLNGEGHLYLGQDGKNGLVIEYTC